VDLVVSFIIRIYHDARSPERQTDLESVTLLLRTLQDLGSNFGDRSQ